MASGWRAPSSVPISRSIGGFIDLALEAEAEVGEILREAE